MTKDLTYTVQQKSTYLLTNFSDTRGFHLLMLEEYNLGGRCVVDTYTNRYQFDDLRGAKVFILGFLTTRKYGNLPAILDLHETTAQDSLNINFIPKPYGRKVTVKTPEGTSLISLLEYYKTGRALLSRGDGTMNRRGTIEELRQYLSEKLVSRGQKVPDELMTPEKKDSEMYGYQTPNHNVFTVTTKDDRVFFDFTRSEGLPVEEIDKLIEGLYNAKFQLVLEIEEKERKAKLAEIKRALTERRDGVAADLQLGSRPYRLLSRELQERIDEIIEVEDKLKELRTWH